MKIQSQSLDAKSDAYGIYVQDKQEEGGRGEQDFKRNKSSSAREQQTRECGGGGWLARMAGEVLAVSPYLPRLFRSLKPHVPQLLGAVNEKRQVTLT